MRRIHPALLATLIVSVVLAVGGVAVIGVSTRPPVSEGWFAYQPMSDSVFSPTGVIMLTQTGLIGVAVATIGLIGVSATIGFAIGRRRRPDVDQ
ncbi:hypothetical protein [Agromyces laixinhei]|uniref:hypothetical protein n=1 Tax=Agromyces laixinhei TaxID=2585717 RepID=UPI001115BF13|nr:hypothetical protein [Agromyces laixinhei]